MHRWNPFWRELVKIILPGLAFPFHFICRAFDPQKFFIFSVSSHGMFVSGSCVCVFFWESVWTPQKKVVFFLYVFSSRSWAWNHLEFGCVCIWFLFFPYERPVISSFFIEWLLVYWLISNLSSVVYYNECSKNQKSQCSKGEKEILCKWSNNLLFF